jgi:hypothetical protein
MIMIRLCPMLLGLAMTSEVFAAGSTLPSVDVNDSSAVVVDCVSPAYPKMRDVAQLIETENSAAVHRTREHLMQIARTHCSRGADFVKFVRGTEQQARELGLASLAVLIP